MISNYLIKLYIIHGFMDTKTIHTLSREVQVQLIINSKPEAEW